jgi:endonuclease/exonuclease/phosphatase family metal-dependent hydrolase
VQLFNNYSFDDVANAILEQHPDIVCLQEMPTTGNEREFGALLKGYEVIYAGRLAVATAIPVEESSRQQLSANGRRALVVDVSLHGQSIRIVNVHLQHFPSDQLSRAGEAGRNLVKEVAGLEKVITDDAIPTIVAGDLNSIPQGRANQMLRSLLTDCFAATSRGYGFTLPAHFPVRRVDYIYVGFGLVPMRSEVMESVVSDHRGVVADIALAN